MLEGQDQPGGRMANRTAGSLLLETGASVLFNFYTDMRELIRDVGIDERMVALLEGETATVCDGQREYFLSVQASVLQLITCPAMSLRSKLRLPLLLPDLRDARRCAVQGNRVAPLFDVLTAQEQAFFDAVRYTKLGIVHYVLKQPPAKFRGIYTRHHPGRFSIYRAVPGNPAVAGDPPRLYCELSPQPALLAVTLAT